MVFKGKKGSKIMTTLSSSILKVDELPKEKIHFFEHFTGENDTSEKSHHSPHSFTYLETMLFKVCYRPKDGLTNEEIKKITEFVLKSDCILYYAMGVEVTGSGEIKTRHLHIRVVMKVMCRYEKVYRLFEPLMNGARLAPKPDIALKVITCKRSEVRNKTVLLHSVYALKEAARDKAAHEITSEHWNNRITTWTNIFDGKENCVGDAMESWKWKEDRFKHLLFKKFHTNHKPTVTITSGNAIELMKEWCHKNNIEFSLEKRAEIVACMVTDRTGNLNFEETLIKGKSKMALDSIKQEDNYKTMLKKKLQDYYEECDKLLGRRRVIEEKRSSADIQLIERLKCEVERLEREVERLKRKNFTLENICKGHVTTIDILKKRRSVQPLQPVAKRQKAEKTADHTRQDHILELRKRFLNE